MEEKEKEGRIRRKAHFLACMMGGMIFQRRKYHKKRFQEVRGKSYDPDGNLVADKMPRNI